MISTKTSNVLQLLRMVSLEVVPNRTSTLWSPSLISLLVAPKKDMDSWTHMLIAWFRSAILTCFYPRHRASPTTKGGSVAGRKIRR